MNLNPLKHKGIPDYPTASAHRADRREFLRTLGKTGLALSLCAIASPSVAAMAAPIETEEDKKKAAEKLAEIKIEVAALSTKLESKDFKVRKSATDKLIEIGKPKLKDGKDQSAPARSLVLVKMKELGKHKDPEVKTRAKQITVALTPKPIKVDHPRMGGVMVAPQHRAH